MPDGVARAMREEIRGLLAEARVNHFACYGQGSDWFRVRPQFLRDAGAAAGVVWNRFCANNLAVYLQDARWRDLRVGVVVKPCDARGVVELVKDGQLKREMLFVLGAECDGMIDVRKASDVLADGRFCATGVEEKDGEFIIKGQGGEQRRKREEWLFDKCLSCELEFPPVTDTLLRLARRPQRGAAPAYGDVREMEALSVVQRRSFWERQFTRCIRCYACRNACPVCYCKVCAFDKVEPRWVGKGVVAAENMVFHLTRAFHTASRCVDCGECERACPMHLPLRRLNRKLAKDVEELFGYRAGLDMEAVSPLREYKLADPDEFS